MMTLFALLTKEMRLRLRRERTIWVIVLYICFMGLLGWLTISHYSSQLSYTNNALNSAGASLYLLLSQLQLLLIIFITPAFTATAINSEKERQTFDLLLCSRLSSFSMASGKLLAGLTNALLLIVASAPLFSLVFFFGGVALLGFLKTLLIFAVTTIVVGTFGLLCSALFKHPAVSTSVTYLVCLLWLCLPMFMNLFLSSSNSSVLLQMRGAIKIRSVPPLGAQMPLWQAGYPLIALSNANPSLGNTYSSFNLLNYMNVFSQPQFIIIQLNGQSTINSITTSLGGGLTVSSLTAYFVLCLGMSTVFFLVSTLIMKPNSPRRLPTRNNRLFSKDLSNKKGLSYGNAYADKSS